MVLTETGLAKVFQRIKSFVASQLNSKASAIHTHSISDITDMPSAITVDSALSSSSENPVQNKVVKNALDGKLDVTDVFATWNYSNGNLEIPNIYSSDIDSALSSTSENPVQNKVINSALANYIPRSGGAVMTGDTIARTVDNSYLEINGSSSNVNGAYITLHGKNYGDAFYAGSAYILTSDGSNTRSMLLKPDGTLTWGSKNIAMYEDVVPRRGGAVMTGDSYRRTVDNSALKFHGGTDYGHGAYLQINGKDYSDSGHFLLVANDGTQTKGFRGRPDGTLIWSGQPIQYISDQRYKQQIDQIDDKLLDAWEGVTLCQFKYNDAVDQKGDNARLHTGYVVQQIDEACKSHNVDISEYGLYCHEEYPERTEEVEVTQDDGTTTKETKVIEEASEHYSLRYTETLVVECAYLRKQIKELKARLDKLEGGETK